MSAGLVGSDTMATRKKRPVDDGEKLLAKARAAAKKRKPLEEPLSRSAALAEAPWKEAYAPAWERPFREAYADALAARGVAGGKARQGTSSKTSGVTVLKRRPMQATKQEFSEQDVKAKAAGLSWSAWARRKLLT